MVIADRCSTCSTWKIMWQVCWQVQNCVAIGATLTCQQEIFLSQLSLLQGPAKHLVWSGIIKLGSHEHEKKNISKLESNQILQLQSQNSRLLTACPSLFAPHLKDEKKPTNRPIVNLTLTIETLLSTWSNLLLWY